jgi:ADP-ribose pyrophosphatase YjhB (NUDIX family)
MSALRNDIEVIARGVCIKAGQLLVCHGKGSKNTYLPGGHIELGEKAKHSLKREMAEEMGLSVTVGRYLGAVEHSYERKGVLQHEVNLIFKMTCKALDPSRAAKSCEDYIEFFWVPLAELRKSTLEPHVLRKMIPRWFSSAAGVDRWSSTM